MNLTSGNKKKIIFGVSIAAGCLLLLGIFFLIRNLSRVSTDDAYIDGRIHSIAPKISGTILKVNIRDNQNIKKGDILIEIDPVDYEAKFHEADAALAAEKAKLADAFAGIKAAQANLDIQIVTLKQAFLDYRRAQALFQKGTVTRERFEKMTTAYNLGVAQVKAAKEQLNKSQSLKDIEESLVKQRQATLRLAELNLGYTKLIAPSDGYITNKSVEEGNQVQPGTPLASVVALNDIWVVANYKETQVRNVHPGQRVLIGIDTYKGFVFTGKVESIMAGTGAAFSLFPPENALGNYVKVVQRIPVKIVFDQVLDDRHTLRLGMSCQPTILTGNE